MSHLARMLIASIVLTQTGLSQPADNTASMYFPIDGKPWETVTPEQAGLDSADLRKAIDFAMSRSSSSVVILWKGRIVTESHQYLKSPSRRYTGSLQGANAAGHAIEDVASVQKSITSVLVGIAQEKGLLKLDDTVSNHLGHGWSKATAEQEGQITVRHLISMTSGLTEQLEFAKAPGTEWKYNSTAYAQSLNVVAAAAKKTPHDLTSEWLTGPIGMKDTKWVERKNAESREIAGNTLGFATSAHDLARFGLMVLNKGKWGDTTIIGDQQYLIEMTSTSQRLNQAYGYLWWLNGKDSVVRASRKTKGPLVPTAPKSMFAALGALGRKCYVVPSMDVVIVRLGDSPDATGRRTFDTEFWRLLKEAADKRQHVR